MDLNQIENKILMKLNLKKDYSTIMTLHIVIIENFIYILLVYLDTNPYGNL
jgi:hypothetical protein